MRWLERRLEKLERRDRVKRAPLRSVFIVNGVDPDPAQLAEIAAAEAAGRDVFVIELVAPPREDPTSPTCSAVDLSRQSSSLSPTTTTGELHVP